jgi:hypothetical protein
MALQYPRPRPRLAHWPGLARRPIRRVTSLPPFARQRVLVLQPRLIVDVAREGRLLLKMKHFILFCILVALSRVLLMMITWLRDQAGVMVPPLVVMVVGSSGSSLRARGVWMFPAWSRWQLRLSRKMTVVGEAMSCGHWSPKRMVDGEALWSGVVGGGCQSCPSGSSASSKSTRSSRGAEV